MKVHIGYRPAQSVARVNLDTGESVIVDHSATVGMSPNVRLAALEHSDRHAHGAGAAARGAEPKHPPSAVAEPIQRASLCAQGAPGEVLLAARWPGDLLLLELMPGGYLFQSTAFVAASPDVRLDEQLDGLDALFSLGATPEAAPVHAIKARSEQPGQLLLGACGAIEPLECEGELILEMGHVLAWEAALEVRDSGVDVARGGWLARLTPARRALRCFAGRGRVWVQTRDPVALGRRLGRALPRRHA